MKKKSSSLKVVWAIDVQAAEKKVRQSAEKLLQLIGRKTPLEVIPVFVARTPEVPMGSHWEMDLYKDNLKKLMGKWLTGCELKNVKSPVVLIQKGIYLRAEVDAIALFAKKNGADLVLVNTHARKGMSRFWQGSFSESLLSQTKVPVLFINPHVRLSGSLRTLIYPTNLSPECEKVVQKVAALAKRLKTQLILYNNVEYFVAAPGLSFTESLVFERQVERDIDQRQKNLKKLAQKLKSKFGISVRVVVDEGDVSAAKAILRQGKKIPSSMTIMTALTGPVLSTLVGSTTRQVVRGSEEPVLVFR